MQRKKFLERFLIVLGVSCFLVIVLSVQIVLSLRERRENPVSDAISERFGEMFLQIQQSFRATQSSSDKQ